MPTPSNVVLIYLVYHMYRKRYNAFRIITRYYMDQRNRHLLAPLYRIRDSYKIFLFLKA